MTALSCNEVSDKRETSLSAYEVEINIPNVAFSLEELFYNTSKSRWRRKSDSSLISGIVKQESTSGQLIKTFQLFKGKKEGRQNTYYPTGKLKFLETYQTNRLHGDVKRWSYQNGYRLIAHLQYQNGKLHGEQLKWYPTGELHKRLNLFEGKEKGLQQAFRKNGALYANYEAKNGRIFGIKRSNLCFELDSEKIVYKQEDKVKRSAVNPS